MKRNTFSGIFYQLDLGVIFLLYQDECYCLDPQWSNTKMLRLANHATYFSHKKKFYVESIEKE